MPKRWLPKGIISGRFRAATGTLTGQNIEDALSEYSAVYGEVLLGMHREVQTLKADLQQQRVSAYANDAELRLLRQDLSALKEGHLGTAHSRTARRERPASSDLIACVISTAALILGLVAVGLTVLT
jgi:hypothetical protein